MTPRCPDCDADLVRKPGTKWWICVSCVERRRGTGGTSTSLARWWDTPTEIAAYATGQTEAVRKQRPS